MKDTTAKGTTRAYIYRRPTGKVWLRNLNWPGKSQSSIRDELQRIADGNRGRPQDRCLIFRTRKGRLCPDDVWTRNGGDLLDPTSGVYLKVAPGHPDVDWHLTCPVGHVQESKMTHPRPHIDSATKAPDGRYTYADMVGSFRRAIASERKPAAGLSIRDWCIGLLERVGAVRDVRSLDPMYYDLVVRELHKFIEGDAVEVHTPMSKRPTHINRDTALHAKAILYHSIKGCKKCGGHIYYASSGACKACIMARHAARKNQRHEIDAEVVAQREAYAEWCKQTYEAYSERGYVAWCKGVPEPDRRVAWHGMKVVGPRDIEDRLLAIAGRYCGADFTTHKEGEGFRYSFAIAPSLFNAANAAIKRVRHAHPLKPTKVKAVVEPVPDQSAKESDSDYFERIFKTHIRGKK